MISICMNIALFVGILLLLGLIATRASRKINLPNVTAFLVIGLLIAVVCILIDKTGYVGSLGITLTEELTRINTFVASIALGFIALSIGEEFKFSKIKEYGSKVILITFLQAFGAVILVDAGLLLVCYLCNLNYAIAFVLGAIATATAPAATLMVIHQYKAKGPLVDLLLPVVAFDDAIGLMVFALSTSIAKLFVTTASISIVSILLVPLLEIVGSLLIGFVLGLLLHVTMKYFKSRNNHMIIVIAFTLLGVGACAALNTLKINDSNLNFSSLLACMVIGAVYVNYTNDEQKPILTRDIELMDRWTPFLFTLFFVLSGAHLVTSAYEIFSSGDNSSIYIIVVVFFTYLILRSLGKYLGAFFGCKITKRSKEITHYLGLTLLPQAGVAIGMANQIGDMEIFKVNNMGNIIVTVVLLATLVYELVGPLLTKFALNKAGEIPSEE
ncbi:MAG: hypothetical protein E7178_03565 [Erysipelotrichaceae bacterium]|nr:hypothetical protein [Erysipelotrichaceae bacterium]